MRIKINGEEKFFERKEIILSNLLSDLNIDQQYNVIAVNYECIKKTQYDKTEIKDGDEIEILSPMQGG